jgi:putative hydrolase of HD superfamily
MTESETPPTVQQAEEGIDAADRLDRQLRFLVEIDRLKTVVRKTKITDKSRYENSAEHSWHLALMATVLAEHSPAGVDVSHALSMLLVHDLVEIDAGDFAWYDAAANQGKRERELAAATRLFGLLPSDQSSQLLALWEEFEANKTPAARYANALDRVQPLLLTRYTQDGDWAFSSASRERLLGRMAPVEDGCPPLWQRVTAIIEEAFATGRYGRAERTGE